MPGWSMADGNWVPQRLGTGPSPTFLLLERKGGGQRCLSNSRSLFPVTMMTALPSDVGSVVLEFIVTLRFLLPGPTWGRGLSMPCSGGRVRHARWARWPVGAARPVCPKCKLRPPRPPPPMFWPVPGHPPGRPCLVRAPQCGPSVPPTFLLFSVSLAMPSGLSRGLCPPCLPSSPSPGPPPLRPAMLASERLSLGVHLPESGLACTPLGVAQALVQGVGTNLSER